ncbi:MAG: hypothetical protein H3C41_07855 [Bacteroidales bacterium]|nr:hypothetical protein [Bacteroidales bacterium]
MTLLHKGMSTAGKEDLLSDHFLYQDFRQLMDSAFPENERRPEAGFRKQLMADCFKIRLFLDERSQLISFITYWALDDFFFVEHLAVVKSQRGQGRFSAMLSQLNEFEGKTVVFEVEPPASLPAIERIAIYRHKGFYVYDFPYQQPPYHVDNNPVTMLLMGNRPQPSDNFIKAWVDKIHHVVYSSDFF